MNANADGTAANNFLQTNETILDDSYEQIWAWDGGQWNTYNLTENTVKHIAPGEGFFIRLTSTLGTDTAGSVIFNESMQKNGSFRNFKIASASKEIRVSGIKSSKKVFAMTCPLITKTDGSKFGKTEDGNVWLDKKKTSPYKFYQYWLNISDADAINYIKIFTFKNKSEVRKYIKEHQEFPHKRLIQKLIANYLTKLVHSQNDLDNAINASIVTDLSLIHISEPTRPY